MLNCDFRSKEPIANDVYKVPETRYLCRCVARMQSKDHMQSDRFIGETDCETCEFRKDSTETNEGSN